MRTFLDSGVLLTAWRGTEANALRLTADEFITTETSGKALFRVAGLKVTSLHAVKS